MTGGARDPQQNSLLFPQHFLMSKMIFNYTQYSSSASIFFEKGKNDLLKVETKIER
jgi:hypothetical protein